MAMPNASAGPRIEPSVDLHQIVTSNLRKHADPRWNCVVFSCEETFSTETKWKTHIRETHNDEISHLKTEEQYSDWLNEKKEECKIAKPRGKIPVNTTSPNLARDRTLRASPRGGEITTGVKNMVLGIESTPENAHDDDTSMADAPVQEAQKKPGSTRKAPNRKARPQGAARGAPGARREVDPDFDRGPPTSQRQIWTEDQPINAFKTSEDTAIQQSPTFSRPRKENKRGKPGGKHAHQEAPKPPEHGLLPQAKGSGINTNVASLKPQTIPEEDDPQLRMVRQPETRPISPEQLLNEVRGIYAGLVMVEAKCIEVDRKQAAQIKDLVIEGLGATHLTNEQFQALIALHRTLLHEHHDFFLASQHPSAGKSLQRLAEKYEMPARMWRHGIHSFLELLRNRLPYSLEHMLTFIYLAYSMMALLYETVPAFEDTWIECLGDLGRYRMAIEDGDVRDREVWTVVARTWYFKASDRKPTVGRLYHHISILARPNVLQQLFYYCKSLTVRIPFASARESILSLFEKVPISGHASRSPHVDVSLVSLHAMWFMHTNLERFEGLLDEYISMLDTHLGTSSEKWTVRGCLIAICNIAALYQYNTAQGGRLRQAELEGKRKAIKKEEQTEIANTPSELNADEGLLLPQLAKAVPTEHRHTQDLRSEDASSVDFSYALKMGFRILDLVLQRGMDEQVLPHVHAWLAFLYHVKDSIPVMRLLETDFPWDNLAAFLNCLVPNSEVVTGSFPRGQGRPLPEDYTLRGLEWTKNYFPPLWIEDAKVDDEERLLELPSFLALRTQRILWLGYNIAMAGDWIHYDQEGERFSMHSGIAKRIDSFRAEALINRETDILYIKKEIESDVEMEPVQIADDEYEEFDYHEQSEELLQLQALKLKKHQLRTQLKQERHVDEYLEMNVEATRRVSPREALKPKYTALVVDTNLMLSSLEIFKSALAVDAWPLVVPNPVLTELMGLQNSNETIADAAKRAILTIQRAIAAKKDVKIITAKGSNVTNASFFKEKLDEYQEDEKKLDDVIIEITQLVGNQRADMMRKNGEDPGQAQPAVLVTDDRNMRVKATAKSVPAIDSLELKAILTPSMVPSRQKKKPSAGSPFKTLKQQFPTCPDGDINAALADANGNIETAQYILTNLESGRRPFANAKKPKKDIIRTARPG